MKKIVLVLALFTAVFFNLGAQTTVASMGIFKQEGIASWYGKEYDGRPTASGEIFDSSQLTCAHPSLPFGTVVTVTNMHNNKSVTVRVNDRGPFVPARIIDISRAAAEKIDMIITGTAPVKVESIDKIAVSSPTPQTTVQQAAPVVSIAPRVEAVPRIAPAQQTAPVVSSAPQTGTTTEPVAAPTLQIGTVTAPAASPAAAPVVIQPVVTPAPQFSVICTLSPAITLVPEKTYRLQVGSYKNARNAISAFGRLKNAGLNPAYERFIDEASEYFRVVLAGVRGYDVQLIAEKLGEAGFREALIKEE